MAKKYSTMMLESDVQKRLRLYAVDNEMTNSQAIGQLLDMVEGKKYE